MADWKLSRRHPACLTCEHVFEEGERHFSRLELSADQIQRQDFCRACWPAAPETGWIWWRATREAARRTGLQVDWDVLERIFVTLAETTSERLAQVRYLLSLLLLRKRRLMLVRAVRHGDGEALVVRRPRRKDEQLVRAFDLEPQRMEELRAELQQLFEGEDLATLTTRPDVAPLGSTPAVDELVGEAGDAGDNGDTGDTGDTGDNGDTGSEVEATASAAVDTDGVE